MRATSSSKKPARIHWASSSRVQPLSAQAGQELCLSVPAFFCLEGISKDRKLSPALVCREVCKTRQSTPRRAGEKVPGSGRAQCWLFAKGRAVKGSGLESGEGDTEPRSAHSQPL